MWQGLLQTTILHAVSVLASLQDGIPFSFEKTSCLLRRTYGCSPATSEFKIHPLSMGGYLHCVFVS